MKYRPIFITATNTDIGKTYATGKLIEELSNQGLKVGVFKPIETGVVDEPLDGKLLLELAKKYNADFKSFTCKDVVPVQFELPAAPYVSKGDAKIDLDILHSTFEKIANACDIVLIEGAGGLMVPIEKNLYMYDFIKEFNAAALLVTHANLGCINDTLLNINLLDSLKVDYVWCVNFRDNKESFQKTTLPYYQDRFGKVLSLQSDMKQIVDSIVNRD